jgi:hypothetical protein
LVLAFVEETGGGGRVGYRWIEIGIRCGE